MTYQFTLKAADGTDLVVSEPVAMGDQLRLAGKLAVDQILREHPTVAWKTAVVTIVRGDD